jgi:internalin A
MPRLNFYCALVAVMAALFLLSASTAHAQLNEDPDDVIDQYMPRKWARSIEAVIADSGAKFLRPRLMTSVAALAKLTEKKDLKGLRLSSVSLPDLSFLRNLPQLEVLELSNCSITDISELSRLPNLRVLELSYNQISDLSPLTSLDKLEVLLLYRNLVEDLSPLSGLTQLRHLDLSDCQVADINPLAGMTLLAALSLYKNERIRDFSPIARLSCLTDLNLSFCHAPSLTTEMLAGMPKLLNLRLQGRMISSPDQVAAIGRMASLEQLTLGMNPVITDLAPLANLSKLLYLDVHSCSISDRTPVGKLTNLRKLVANVNRIRDLSPLVNCTRLHSLFCFGNPIASADVLLKMTSLRMVSLPKESFDLAKQEFLRERVPRNLKLRFL